MDNRLNLVVNFAEKGLSQLSGGLKNLVGLGKSGGRALRDMARDSRSLQRELAGVRRELANSSGNVTALIDRERDLERQIERANAAMKRQAALNKIDDRAAAMRSRGEALMNRGRENITGGAMMLAPILLAAKAGADFSSGMVDIQQKAELSDAATARLRNNILAAARASKQMPEDIRAAVDTLAGLGLSPEEAVQAAKPMGQFMTAFKVEGTDAAASVFAGFQNLNIPLARTGKLLDMMAQGGNQGAFEAKDMAAALPGLTAQLKALGQTGEGAGAELVAALEIVRRGTGDSEAAATNVQNLLAKLTATTTLQQFQKHGIDAFAAVKKGMEQGISPLETMIALTRKATGGDMMKIGQLFPDMQAGAAMRQLMLDFKDFQAMKANIAGADGVTARAFDQRVANDQTVQLRALGSEMVNLALSASPVLLPFLREMTQDLSTGAAAVSSWAHRHPAAAGALLKLVTAVALGKIALGGLQFAFGGVLKPMSLAYKYFAKVDGISRFTTHLGMLKNGAASAASVGMRAFGLLRTGTMLLARGVVRAGLMMMANPMVLAITALVLAIGVAAYLIYTHWDRIKAAFGQGITFIAGLGSRLYAIGSNIVHALAEGIAAAPGAVWNALKNVVLGGVTRVKGWLGIHSPSRVFMALGGHTATGFALGIDRKRSAAFASARRLAAGVAGAAALSAGAPLAAAGGAPAARLPVGPSWGSVTIEIHQQPGESAQDLARRVKKLLEDEERKRRGSGFGDD